MPELKSMRPAQTGQVIVMTPKDLDAYRRHVESFVAEYHPQGATECHLVQSLADTAWRLNRVAALESTIIASSIRGEGDLDNAISMAAMLESRVLVNLSMHGQRLSRQFERTVAHLKSLQSEHRASEDEKMNHALDVIEMFETRKKTFDPAANGFVFSKKQIADAKLARSRALLIKEAAQIHEHAA